MEHILSSIFPKKPRLSNGNSLQTILLENSSILVHIDNTTFASPSTKFNEHIPVKRNDLKSRLEDESKTNCKIRKCVLGCKDIKGLHRSPRDESGREIWRIKLKMKAIKKNDRFCNRHFTKTFGENKKRLPAWAVPDSPEPSDSEENYTTEENIFKKLHPQLNFKLLNVLKKNTKEAEINPEDFQIQKLFSLEDILACK